MSYFLDFRFTEDAGAVIRKLEDTKTGSKEEHDKQVMKTLCEIAFLAPGFDQKIETLVAHLSLWVFHSG